MDKSKMIDSMGRPYTQGLFYEFATDDNACYTLKDYDLKVGDKIYPSLKRLYLEKEDPTEYEFAIEHLSSWKQWQRMTENKSLLAHIQEWREELEYRIRSKATKKMIDQAMDGNFQATKWLTDRGWISRGAGRPTSEEKIKHLAQSERIQNEYADDIQRLKRVK